MSAQLLLPGPTFLEQFVLVARPAASAHFSEFAIASEAIFQKGTSLKAKSLLLWREA